MSWSVYIHTVPNGKVYVGVTGRPPKRRWGGGYNYRANPTFYADIKKYGWNNIRHEVVYEGIPQEEALIKEKELIIRYGSTDKNKGYNVLVGKSGIGSHNPFYGKKHSEEFKKWNSERMKGTEHHRTAVVQIDKNGNIIAEFPSIKSASFATNINYKSIVNCCSGVTKKAGGYFWKHKHKKTKTNL